MTRIRVIVGDVDIRVDDPHHHLAVAAATRLLTIALKHVVPADADDDVEPRTPLGFTASMDLDPGRHDLVLGEPMWDE